MAKIAAIKNGKDSVGIYYVGSNSTKDPHRARILSFTPRHHDVQARPDTIKRRAMPTSTTWFVLNFYLHNGKDSLVKYVEEVVL